MGHDSWATEEELAEPCAVCGKLPSAHYLFAFSKTPAYYKECPEAKPEWIPDPDFYFDDDMLPEDPSRVAYRFKDGEPAVMVYGGPDEGYYLSCSSSQVNGIVWWVCRLKGPKDPATEDFMRTIST